MTSTPISGKPTRLPSGADLLPLSPDGNATAASVAALANTFASSVAAAAQAASQPLDADLTAIAALTTTAFGRAFLTLANAAAGQTALGLGTAATHASSDFAEVNPAVGAPTTGAHVVGEVVISTDGHVWRCTVAGTPGTWADITSGSDDDALLWMGIY